MKVRESWQVTCLLHNMRADPGSLEHPVKPDGVGYVSNPSAPTVTWEAAAGESWTVLGQRAWTAQQCTGNLVPNKIEGEG